METEEIVIMSVYDGGALFYVVGQAVPKRCQYPRISPRQFRELGRFREVNDATRVAKAFGWEPSDD